MGNAIDDFYAGIVQPPIVIRTTGTGPTLAISKVQSVATKGGWAQLVLSPFPFLQLTAGYGVAVANTAQMVGMANNVRYRNSQFAWGVIFPAGQVLALQRRGGHHRHQLLRWAERDGFHVRPVEPAVVLA